MLGTKAKRTENKQSGRKKMCVGGEGVGEGSPRDFFSNVCLLLFQIRELILERRINKEVP